MDLETIKRQPLADAEKSILLELPKMYHQIQERCQSETLSTLQLLGFTETVFNGLLCAAGLLNNNLVIRWPRNYDILFMAKQASKHDWFLIPEESSNDSRVKVYVSALKTANMLFSYLLKMNNSSLTSQILWQALKQGVSSAQQNHLPISVRRSDTAVLVVVMKEGGAAGKEH